MAGTKTRQHSITAKTAFHAVYDVNELECTDKAKTALAEIIGGIPEKSLAVLMFGSQARGDATERSDLDIMNVVERLEDGIWPTITDDDGNEVIKTTMLPETLESMKRCVNVYGTTEYNAFREGKLLHVKPEGLKILDMVLDYDSVDGFDVAAFAPYWLDVAKTTINDIGRAIENKRLDYACLLASRAIDASVKSMLLRDRIKFPFTRYLDDLCDLLPDKSVISELNVSNVALWQKEHSSLLGNGKRTADDAALGLEMARRAYDVARTKEATRH